MRLENFSPGLALSLNCSGALLPGPFNPPWAASFQAWGLGKGGNGGFSVGAPRGPQTLRVGNSRAPPHPQRARDPDQEPPPARRACPLPPPSPPPLGFPSQPHTHHTSRPLAPGGSFSMPGGPLAASDVGQGTMRELGYHGKSQVFQT